VEFGEQVGKGAGNLTQSDIKAGAQRLRKKVKILVQKPLESTLRAHLLQYTV
jgi:hypothetical protein